MRIKDLTEKRFGKLMAKKIVGKSKSGNMLWECLCECGNTKIIQSTALVQGLTRSCGCLNKQVSSARIRKYNDTHDRKGPNNYNWNPNLTDEERLQNRTRNPENYAWRMEVFDRDSFTCQVCKKHGCALNAHHLYSYAKHPDKRTILNNGITLCNKCHRAFHHKYGNDSTPEQFVEFMESINA